MILNKKVPFFYVFSLIRKQFVLLVVVVGLLSYLDQFIEPIFGLEFPLMPMLVPAILGTLVTLLLSFKTAQSYDRWWEARKIWGGIVNDSRAFVREVHTFVKSDSDEAREIKKALVYDLIGWSYAMVDAMRGSKIAIDHKYLTEEKKVELQKLDDNIPNAWLFDMMTKLRKAYDLGAITDFEQIRITETINKLGVEMGQSERIKKTVFPHLYSRVINFSIWLFVFIFPLAFRDHNEFLEFPIVLAITALFIMIENLASSLRDPFENRPSDVPILSIARGIESYALKTLGNDVEQPKQEESFYVM